MKHSEEIAVLVDAVETDPEATKEDIYRAQVQWYQALADEGSPRAQEIIGWYLEHRPDMLEQ